MVIYAIGEARAGKSMNNLTNIGRGIYILSGN